MNFIKSLKQNILNSIGWRTNRKIVVFESDDWGSSRMGSKDDFNWFYRQGYEVDKCPYNSNDTLERNDDLEGLIYSLNTVSDKFANSGKFTINNIVANPDYERIRLSGFKEYFFEPSTETLKRYPHTDRVMELYGQGINKSSLKVQFHGREHLNINNWMKSLQSGKRASVDAFDREMFTVHSKGALSIRNEFLDAFGLNNPKQIDEYFDIISSGVELFEKIWGYRSKSFIAPTYVWPTFLESKLYHCGIKYIQGTHVQRIPPHSEEGAHQRKYHYLGSKNSYGQVYLVRNAFFEPSSEPTIDWVDSCFSEIERAFWWNKPAIISSHRVNFVGGINENNRVNNLRLLEKLLKKIVDHFPEVEFMFSDELGDLIE